MHLDEGQMSRILYVSANIYRLVQQYSERGMRFGQGAQLGNKNCPEKLGQDMLAFPFNLTPNCTLQIN